MIQRIQSFYLLLVVALLILAMCLPYGVFFADATVYSFSSLSLTTSGGVSHSVWALFILLLLAALLAFLAIFQFKHRVFQMRTCMLTMLLIAGYYIVFLVFLFMFKAQLNAEFRMSWALCLPLISEVILYLAWRAIGKDEALVRSADSFRLR
jgi:presenilin-like A22 family membrane protease